MIPSIVSIAVSYPSGGAGIRADIKTHSAKGGYARAVIAALSALNNQRLARVQMITSNFVAAQIATIRAVLKGLSSLTVPIVPDPVMVEKR